MPAISPARTAAAPGFDLGADRSYVGVLAHRVTPASSLEVSASRRPGLVVAGRSRPAAARQRRAGRPVRCRRPRQVRDVRLFPFARRVAFFGRRDIDGVMQPAMPVRRHARGLGITVVDHPAPLKAERRVDLAADGAIIAITLLVRADQFAKPPCPQLGAKGLAIPPGKEFEQKLFHLISADCSRGLALIAIGGLVCPDKWPASHAVESAQSVHAAYSSVLSD